MPHDVLPGSEPVTLRGARQFEMASKISGRSYQIYVSRPVGPAPEGGYPVVTVTDGNLTFPLAATTATALTISGDKPVIVVGVGYAADDQLMALRNRDLTPPTPKSALIAIPGMPEPREADYGGAVEFRRFLLEELRPAIAAAYPVNPDDQTLYGHSLGGLFTLTVLFAEPKAFRTYAISSPSIWWNSRAILEGEAAFARAVEAGEITPRVLVTIGATEQDPPRVAPPGMTLEAAAERMRLGRMVDNARELGERLVTLKGAAGYKAAFQNFQAEDHMSVVPASIARAITFALRD
ncbi:alpha/beta hydrolase [Caulobacter sp. KR2-114]|uniref:alpha/beta hydrolase n=1 Tax=Caulobacter sp. KR2-114 TaxID=3400912 RepID=UPI003C08CFCD